MSTIEIKQLSFSYDGAGLTLFDHVDLTIDSTWKLGLIGRNGRGKTTFFKLLQNELAYSGTINHQIDFSYFPQAIKDKNKMTIEEKEKLLKNIDFIDPLTMNFNPDHHKTLLTVENFTLSFNDEPLFKPITFDIKQGERVVIAGANGVGKTSFIKAILEQFEGEMIGGITKVTTQRWSHVRQNYEVNQGALNKFCLENKLNSQDFLSNLKKLGLERELFSKPIETMSMGQRKKVEVAKSLTEETPFYLWDEPLNYLDIFNYEQLEEIILLKKSTMLFIEHDESFIKQVATKIITLEKY